MNKKLLINGVMAAQLFVIAGGGVYATNVIDDKNEIIKENKEVMKKKDQYAISKENQINELLKNVELLNYKLNEKDILIAEQVGVIDYHENTINNLRIKIEELEKKIKEQEEKNQQIQNQIIKVEATAYDNSPAQNGGEYENRVLTASGYDITNTIKYQGMGIIAADTSVIPMYSIVEIEGLAGKYIVLDRGGAIKGNKIDILMASDVEARKWGRKTVNLTITKKG